MAEFLFHKWLESKDIIFITSTESTVNILVRTTWSQMLKSKLAIFFFFVRNCLFDLPIKEIFKC